VIITFLESSTDNCRDVSLDYKLSGYLSCLPGPSNPAKLDSFLEPILGQDILIPKTSCSVFNSTNIDYVLRNLQVEQLIVCGQLTNECVESAVRDAADLGYLISLVDDACLAVDNDKHSKGIFGMKGFSRIVTTNQVIKELASMNILLETDSSVARNVETSEAPSTTVEAASFIQPYQIPGIEHGALKALTSSLYYCQVKYIRFAIVDSGGSIRCKAKPMNGIDFDSDLANLVYFAKVVSAGLPSYGDCLIAKSGLDASGSLSLKPDLASLKILPYAANSAMIMCYQLEKNQPSNFCTRSILQKVLHSAANAFHLGFCVGAELEFCLYKKDTCEPVDFSVFANTNILNEQEDFIVDLEEMLLRQGIELELIHAESSNGQLEVVLKYQTDVIRLADNVIFAKETIMACARKHGMKAIFLPKICDKQAGNGLHLHFSFFDTRDYQKNNLFGDYDTKEEISSKGKSFMEGILQQLPSLLSFTLPSNNSFHRVGPGCWTGSTASWAIEDKEYSLRVCLDPQQYVSNVEFKLSDSFANIYLELAAIIFSGLHGISNNLILRSMNSFENKLPETLNESLDLLEQNVDFKNLLGCEFIQAYVAVKKNEVEFFKNMTLGDELAFFYNRA